MSLLTDVLTIIGIVITIFAFEILYENLNKPDKLRKILGWIWKAIKK